jgi:hypothetical protein
MKFSMKLHLNFTESYSERICQQRFKLDEGLQK